MIKRYCENLDMMKSIYHTSFNGKLEARVVIRDRLTTKDLQDVITQALINLEAIREDKRQRQLRKEAISNYYKGRSGVHPRWFKNDFMHI